MNHGDEPRPLRPVRAAGEPGLRSPNRARPADEPPAGTGTALDHGVLRAVCFDLLGRPPLAEERTRWLGLGLADLLDELGTSPSTWEHWFEEQLYYFLLIDNFRPESERLRSTPDELARGRLDAREAIHRIVLSANFDQRNPGADTYVTVVMEQLLGMTVQRSRRELEAGKQMYDGHEATFLGRRGRGQSDVVRIAVEDRGFWPHLVRREHLRLIASEPDRREAARWADALEDGETDFRGLLRSWLESDAYRERLAARRPKSNRLFVRGLFVDLLDRLPDASEERRMRNALDALGDSKPLRSVIARILVDSDAVDVPLPVRGELLEPQEWLTGLFLRLLGRAPDEAELAEFLAAYRDPACRTETVVLALVTHPEYHEY